MIARRCRSWAANNVCRHVCRRSSKTSFTRCHRRQAGPPVRDVPATGRDRSALLARSRCRSLPLRRLRLAWVVPAGVRGQTPRCLSSPIGTPAPRRRSEFNEVCGGPNRFQPDSDRPCRCLGRHLLSAGSGKVVVMRDRRTASEPLAVSGAELDLDVHVGRPQPAEPSIARRAPCRGWMVRPRVNHCGSVHPHVWDRRRRARLRREEGVDAPKDEEGAADCAGAGRWS